MTSPAGRGTHLARGYTLYLLGVSLFALNGTISKSILISGIDPARLSQLRVTAAFLMLFAVVAVRQPAALRLRRAEVPLLLVYGLLGITMTQYLYFVGIDRLPVGITLLIEYTAPIMVALWFRFAWHYPTRPQVWAALVLALFGLALIGQVWNGFTLDAIGVLAAFGAAAALAVYYVAGDRLLRVPEPRDPVSLTMWGFCFASVFWAVMQPWWGFPWAALAGSGSPLGADGPAVPLAALAGWMIVLGTAIPFWLVLAAQRSLRASQAATIGMVEPILATAIAWLALGEALAPVQVLGVAVVLAGVFLAERSR